MAERGRPRKGAARLSREAIRAAALTVTEDEGVAAVGMRSVARRLGVDAKSLYHHVEGKDGLLDAVAEHVLAGIGLPEPVGVLEDDLRAFAWAFRRAALAHPQAATLVLTRQLPSAVALAPVEAVLSVLRKAGAAPEEAVHLLRSLLAMVIGSLLREAGAGPAFGVTDAEAIARREEELTGAGLAETAPFLARCDHEAEFAFAVDFATEAVAARLRR
ncbi:TetR family transcriptional regulator [Amycolatopsis jiangsuensis]|uniref:AcrR family transcriptional regulator n=1 Tax=Amycolatopsis jiangsuensis TaxID=1181879 RepID=A0A840J7F9_9PSEU|nr:TetR family transcriptional regulator [Amycolatopsis jiangsuensis]MBB4689374.1 AcrR family transcriptional regulator [Amycolatopsis jiangsuensis]